jgi:putative nucleotidyltransferase with HDIG domain
VERIDIDLLIQDASELESLPESAQRLTAQFAVEDWDLEEIASTVELDGALTGRLLGIANSVSGGARQQIDSVDAAILRAGPGLLLSLALASAVNSEMQEQVPGYGLADGSLWRHSVAAALAMDKIGRELGTTPPPESFVAALLHDIGKLVIGRRMDRDRNIELYRARASAGRDDAAVERSLLGVDHAEIGARVMRCWGLSGDISEAILHHHAPEGAKTESARELASYVQLANAVAHRIGEGRSDGKTRLTSDCVTRLALSRDRFDAICGAAADDLRQILEMYG